MEEGNELGLIEGRFEGVTEGNIDGLEEGVELGMTEGKLVGVVVGPIEGFDDGNSEGVEVGDIDGYGLLLNENKVPFLLAIYTMDEPADAGEEENPSPMIDV